jgi:LacI family transcriptional regulator
MVTNIALAFDQIHRPTDPYLIPIVRGMGEAAGEQGFHWQVFPLAGDSIFGAEHETLFTQLLESRQIHGVLTCSPFPAEDVARLADLKIPAVEYPAARVPWVIENVSQGVGDLVRHLVDDLGHRRIALIMGPADASSQRVRSSNLLFDELHRQLCQRGIQVPAKHVLHADLLLDTGPVTSEVHQWLTDSNRPTAIVTAVDRHAIEVLNVAAALGVSVPGDVSVASWYDEMENSPLTAVRVPLDQMGREAMALIARTLTGEPVAPSVTPVRLIKRNTTGVAQE